MATASSTDARPIAMLDHPALPTTSGVPTSGKQRSPEDNIMPAIGDRTPLETPLAGQDAFEALFLQFERQVFGYLMRMTGDEQTARDLSQETFLRAWLHFAKLSTYDSPAAWLFRVATNLAISHLRRRATLVGSAQLLGDDDSPARSDPAMHFVEYDLVQRTLLALSPKQRATLVLREVYGFSCDEIARVLGCSRDATKMTLWRGREQFRARYTRENGRR
ncbi:MAG: RNA polymerase sigma factor [Ktedonobacterales bacterium]